MKSRRARGTREETRKAEGRGSGSQTAEMARTVFKQKIRDLFFRIFDAEKSCPSRLRRSLARSLAVRLTRPNKRACSQAKYEPLVVSIEPEGTRTFQNRE